MLKRKNQIHLHLSDLKADFPLIKKMVAIGLPSSVEHSTVALGMNFIIFLVTGFGTVALAAYGLGHRIFGFVIIPTLGLSMATSALVGQNMGAGKIERAEKIVRMAVSMGFVTLTLIGILMFLFAEQLSAVFIPGELETIRMSAQFLKIMALTFGFIGIHHVLNGAFIGSGNTFTSMALSIISLWLLRFPLSYFLSRHTGLKEVGIWIAFPATNVLTALITAAWFSRGTWKKRRITEEIRLIVETTEEALIEEGINP